MQPACQRHQTCSTTSVAMSWGMSSITRRQRKELHHRRLCLRQDLRLLVSEFAPQGRLNEPPNPLLRTRDGLRARHGFSIGIIAFPRGRNP